MNTIHLLCYLLKSVGKRPVVILLCLFMIVGIPAPKKRSWCVVPYSRQALLHNLFQIIEIKFNEIKVQNACKTGIHAGMFI